MKRKILRYIPHNLKVYYNDDVHDVEGFTIIGDRCTLLFENGETAYIDDVRPLLIPLTEIHREYTINGEKIIPAIEIAKNQILLGEYDSVIEESFVAYELDSANSIAVKYTIETNAPNGYTSTRTKDFFINYNYKDLETYKGLNPSMILDFEKFNIDFLDILSDCDGIAQLN